MRTVARVAEVQTQGAAALSVQPAALALPALAGGPLLSHTCGEMLRKTLIVDDYGDHREIDVPVERPLAVFVDGQSVATLYTLGACAEWLVLGYLWNRQIVTDVTCVESICVDWSGGAATVRIRAGAAPVQPIAAYSGLDSAGRVGTDWGGALIGGDALQSARLPARQVSRATLLTLLERASQNDAVYRAAGAVHGCALFYQSELWLSVEDVSRRNAIDSICGWMALHGISGGDMILFTTGRLTAEIVMKAAYNGIATIVSRKGVTALCYDLAERLGMTLFGHAAKGRYICYAGLGRFDAKS